MPKILELNFEKPFRTISFHLQEIRANTYMIKSKDDLVELFKSLRQWLDDFALIDEEDYGEMLKKRTADQFMQNLGKMNENLKKPGEILKQSNGSNIHLSNLLQNENRPMLDAEIIYRSLIVLLIAMIFQHKFCFRIQRS